jgi:hypothetical protein
MAYRRDNSADSALARLSPDYSDQEIRRIWEGNEFATPYLLPELVALDLTTLRKLAVPLILFEGRHDLTEEPGKFFLSLMRFARPIAEKAGDTAP